MRINLFIREIPPRPGHGASVQLFVQALVICKFPLVERAITFLVDTGASYTTILDKDAKRLNINYRDLEPQAEDDWARGIGGPVETYIMREVQLKFLSEDRRRVLWERTLPQVHVLTHPKERYEQIREMPSLLGMDFLRDFCVVVDAPNGIAYLETRDELDPRAGVS